jgi:hypothetical protein
VGVKLGLRNVREEHRLRVIENRVLGKVFGAKREYREVPEDWRQKHSEGLRHLHTALNENEMGRRVMHTGYW